MVFLWCNYCIASITMVLLLSIHGIAILWLFYDCSIAMVFAVVWQ